MYKSAPKLRVLRKESGLESWVYLLRIAEPQDALQKDFEPFHCSDVLRLIGCRSMKAWSCSSDRSSTLP